MIGSSREILGQKPNFSAFWFFATVGGDPGSVAIQERIQQLAKEFPEHVACSHGRLEFFLELLNAADYNILASLYEPHGGCYQGMVLPIARAIDGLAAQIPAWRPTGRAAAELHRLWHRNGHAAGFTFREDPLPNWHQMVHELDELLHGIIRDGNETFRGMVMALSQVTQQAVELSQKDPTAIAQMTREALRLQRVQTWETNYGAMHSHILAARLRRPITD